MKKDLIKPIYSSFLSCEKDAETILRKLFIENPKYGEILKRLLVINTKDCLDNTESQVYKNAIDVMTPAKLIKEGYIRLHPKINMPEHEEVKAYIILSFDNFSANENNPQYRDCTIHFDIICHTDYWKMDNYQIRPLKIAGYIDGILNNTKLSGIGTLNFIGCNELVLDEVLSGYTLSYRAVHGAEDRVPEKE